MDLQEAASKTNEQVCHSSHLFNNNNSVMKLSSLKNNVKTTNAKETFKSDYVVVKVVEEKRIKERTILRPTDRWKMPRTEMRGTCAFPFIATAFSIFLSLGFLEWTFEEEEKKPVLNFYCIEEALSMTIAERSAKEKILIFLNWRSIKWNEWKNPWKKEKKYFYISPPSIK